MVIRSSDHDEQILSPQKTNTSFRDRSPTISPMKEEELNEKDKIILRLKRELEAMKVIVKAKDREIEELKEYNQMMI